MIKFKDFDFDNILLDENSHEKILVYDILYKTLIGPKPLQIRFGKIDGFIGICDRTRYLTLFGPESYDAIYKTIYSKSEKQYQIYFFSLFCKS